MTQRDPGFGGNYRRDDLSDVLWTVGGLSASLIFVGLAVAVVVIRSDLRLLNLLADGALFVLALVAVACLYATVNWGRRL
jgi:hypothetical protein